MTNIFKRVLCLSVVLLMVCGSSAWVFSASQEIRQASETSGTIISPIEERKQALSSGDKIFVALDKIYPAKKGDTLEIFQKAFLKVDKKNPFVRTGRIKVLEIINPRLLLCIIESSTKEIAIGDRIYIPED